MRTGQTEFERMLAQIDAEFDAQEFESEYESESEFPAQCKPQLILDRFELGDYRLRPNHYEPLLTFLTGVRDNPIPPNAGFFVQGHADAQGNVNMNAGLGFARAMEVQRFIRAIAQKPSFAKLRALPITIGSSGKSSPISSNPAANRRVEVGLCVDVKTTGSRATRVAVPFRRQAQRLKA